MAKKRKRAASCRRGSYHGCLPPRRKNGRFKKK